MKREVYKLGRTKSFKKVSPEKKAELKERFIKYFKRVSCD